MQRLAIIIASLIFFASALVSVAQDAQAPQADMIATYEQVRDLYNEGKFKDLDRIADRMRAEKLRRSTGGWQLALFYDWIDGEFERLNARGQESELAHAQKWKNLRPESIAARIVLARAHIKFAWDARGGGYASTVTDEGWKIFNAELEKAWDILETAERKDQKDPELYCWLIVTAMGLGKSDADIDRIFRQGITLEPGYNRLYTKRSDSLLPRWSGKQDAAEKFAQEAARLTSAAEGRSGYAHVAIAAYNYVGREEFMDDLKFDWGRLQGGFDDLLERHPSRLFLIYYARFAVFYKDQAKAKELFAKLAPQDDDFDALLKKGAKWANGAADYPSTTPLHTAAKKGDIEAAKKLLDAGADPDALDAIDNTPLLLAVDAGDKKFAAFILERGADPNHVNASGFAPLHFAASDGDAGMCDLLLDAKAVSDSLGKSGRTALYLAAEGGHLDAIRLMLKKGVRPNTPTENGLTPLYMASLRGHWDAAQELLDAGADTNAITPKGWTPLKVAARDGSLSGVKMLLDRGADPNIRFPMLAAALEGHWDIVALFIERGADVNQASEGDGWTTLMAAARKGHLETIRKLIAKGAQPNAVTSDGWTPLLFALRAPADEAARFLIAQPGVDVNVRFPKTKETALQMAAAHCQKETIEALLDKGADIAARDVIGASALSRARNAKRKDIEEFLRSRGGK